MGRSSPSASVGIARKTCTDHCGRCHQHFHSLDAFDTHRVGDYAKGEGRGTRHCVLAEALPKKLEKWTDDGYCSLSKPALTGIPVWRSVMSERDRKRITEFKRHRP